MNALGGMDGKGKVDGSLAGEESIELADEFRLVLAVQILHVDVDVRKGHCLVHFPRSVQHQKEHSSSLEVHLTRLVSTQRNVLSYRFLHQTTIITLLIKLNSLSHPIIIFKFWSSEGCKGGDWGGGKG